MRKLLKLLMALMPRLRSGTNGVQVGHMHGGTINVNNHLPPAVDQKVEAERSELLTLLGKLTRTGHRNALTGWMEGKFGTSYVKDLKPGQVGLAVRYARGIYANVSRSSKRRQP